MSADMKAPPPGASGALKLRATGALLTATGGLSAFALTPDAAGVLFSGVVISVGVFLTVRAETVLTFSARRRMKRLQTFRATGRAVIPEDLAVIRAAGGAAAALGVFATLTGAAAVPVLFGVLLTAVGALVCASPHAVQRTAGERWIKRHEAETAAGEAPEAPEAAETTKSAENAPTRPNGGPDKR